MDPTLVGLIGIGVMLVLLALGVHIALVLIAVGTFGFMYFVGLPVAVEYVTLSAFHYATYDFVVVPLFVILGLLTAHSGLVEELTNTLTLWIGRIRGGLGLSTVGGCTLFGTVTGSSMVTATVFARVMAPQMRAQGYEKRFSYGICTSSGIIGMLIPPSTLAVVYGLLSEESIGKLLIAGIGPGLLVALLFGIGIVAMITFNGKLAPITAVKATWKERFASLKGLWRIALVGALVVGGIYSGIFTVVEASALGVVVMVVVLAATRSLSWKVVRATLLETTSVTAMCFFLLIGARVFSRFLTLSTIAPNILTKVTSWGVTPLAFIIIMIIVYLILGCFLDSISMLSITLPVIYPIVRALQIDPIWFAMVAIVSIEAGLITPPVGLNMFAVKAVAEPDVTFGDIVRGCVPFIVMLVVVIAFMVAFPPISTFLIK